MRNRICLLTKNRPLTPLLLTDNIEIDRVPAKIKWKYMSLFHCILKIKICMISHQIFYFLLFIFISFYISRYYFSQIFGTSFNIWQKDFCHKFSFFNRFTQTPAPCPPSTPPLVCKGASAPPFLRHPFLKPGCPLFKIFVSPPPFSVPPTFKLF